VDALLAHELAEVEDEPADALERRGRARVGDSLGRLRPARARIRIEQPPQPRQRPATGREPVRIDARGDDPRRVPVRPLPQELLRHRDDVLRPGVHRRGTGQPGAGQVGQRRPATDRVLELGAVHLDREPRAALAGGRGHRAAHDGVVGEHQIGRGGGQLGPDRLHVRGRVAVELGRAHVRDVAGLDAFVAVEHEHRQERPDVRPHHPHPRPEVEPLRPQLLADHDHVVPQPAPGPGDVLGVDVRARALEQVPVPQDEAHGERLPAPRE
jgi:hypothetical protein